MRYYKPLRTLNIKSNFFGLTIDDLLGLMLIYSVFHLSLFLLGLEILAIVLIILLTLILIPIRLKKRRGIIKDYFSFLIHKLIKGNFYD